MACAVVAVGIVRYGNSESSDFLSGNSLAQKLQMCQMRLQLWKRLTEQLSAAV